MTRDEEIKQAAEAYASQMCNLCLDEYCLKMGLTCPNIHESVIAFTDGSEWADEHPNRWISVEDRLPEQNKKVIVICEKLDTAPFYKISLGHIVDKTICKDNYNGWNIPNVVYWTPMPKLPEEI